MNDNFSQCNLIETYPETPYLVLIDNGDGKLSPPRFIIHNQLDTNSYFIGLGSKIFRYETVANQYAKTLTSIVHRRGYNLEAKVERFDFDDLCSLIKEDLLDAERRNKTQIDEEKFKIQRRAPKAEFTVGVGLMLIESMVHTNNPAFKWIHIT